LGTDYSGYSGFTRIPFGPLKPRITDHYDISAYAVDEARGDFGHIWRATYTQSNSAEDIVISISSAGGFITTVRQSLLGWGTVPTFLFGLLIALVLWVVAWRYFMSRMLRMEYHWRGSKLWHDSLIYPGINAAVILAAAIIAAAAYFAGSLTGTAGFMAGLTVAVLLILAALFGVPSILVFLKRHQHSLGASRSRMVMAYIVVALAANSAYLALAFGYAALLGAI
jgi:hypothetical protein